jgi:hypothetical protein
LEAVVKGKATDYVVPGGILRDDDGQGVWNFEREID